LECPRVQEPKDSAERVVTGNPMLQPQDAPQQKFLRAAELSHIGSAFGPAQRGCERNKKDVHKVVTCVGGPRVDQLPENLLEFVHPTPLAIRESPSESIFFAHATRLKSYAIPLPGPGARGLAPAARDQISWSTRPHSGPTKYYCSCATEPASPMRRTPWSS